jgi:hypothetical protein
MGRGVRMLASRSNQYQTGGKLTLVIIRMQLGITGKTISWTPQMDNPFGG